MTNTRRNKQQMTEAREMGMEDKVKPKPIRKPRTSSSTTKSTRKPTLKSFMEKRMTFLDAVDEFTKNPVTITEVLEGFQTMITDLEGIASYYPEHIPLQKKMSVLRLIMSKICMEYTTITVVDTDDDEDDYEPIRGNSYNRIEDDDEPVPDLIQNGCDGCDDDDDTPMIPVVPPVIIPPVLKRQQTIRFNPLDIPSPPTEDDYEVEEWTGRIYNSRLLGDNFKNFKSYFKMLVSWCENVHASDKFDMIAILTKHLRQPIIIARKIWDKYNEYATKYNRSSNDSLDVQDEWKVHAESFGYMWDTILQISVSVDPRMMGKIIFDIVEILKCPNVNELPNEVCLQLLRNFFIEFKWLSKTCMATIDKNLGLDESSDADWSTYLSLYERRIQEKDDSEQQKMVDESRRAYKKEHGDLDDKRRELAEKAKMMDRMENRKPRVVETFSEDGSDSESD